MRKRGVNMTTGLYRVIIALMLAVTILTGCSNATGNKEGNGMSTGEICDFESLDDKVGVFSNADEELYVIDVDTINEKKVDEIKVGDRVMITIDGRKQNSDGTFTPSVIKIEYVEKDPDKEIAF